MSKFGLNTLELDKHYTAKALDSFVNSTEAVLLSSNENQLFAD